MSLVSVSESCYACSIINGTLISLIQDDRNGVQHDFCGHMMSLTKHLHHVMQTALLMSPLNHLGEDGQNQMQHDCFGNMTPITPSLHDASVIVNSTFSFLVSR